MEEPATRRSSGQPSLGTLLALHFLPGGLVFLVYLCTAGSLAARGVPPSFTLHLSFGVVGIPVMLGLLRFLGERETGQSSVFAAIRFRERLRGWQYFLLVPAFLMFAIVASGILAPVTNQLQELARGRAADWFVEPDTVLAPMIIAPWVLFAVRLAIDGIANPIAEELYFRGYMLPRLGALGLFAPLIHGLLFAFAHFWQPQSVPILVVMVVPLYYAVWYFKSVRLSIFVHCAANTLGAVLWIAT